MTRQEYKALFAQQQGCCAICKEPSRRRLLVDRCRRRKVVRGLLCGRCYLGIRAFNEDPCLIRIAAGLLSLVGNRKPRRPAGPAASKRR